VVTGYSYKWNRWGWSEQCKMWSQQTFQE
jgi:hypothetical protein